MLLWNNIQTSQWSLRDLWMKRAEAQARTAGSAPSWSQAEWNEVRRGLGAAQFERNPPKSPPPTPAPVALKRGELDSQKVTQADARTRSEVLAASQFFFCNISSAVFFLLLSAVWLLCDAAVEAAKTSHLWIKSISSICLRFSTLSQLDGWIFLILQWCYYNAWPTFDPLFACLRRFWEKNAWNWKMFVQFPSWR